MSDSVWPHRRQPTRLPHPWDSPGKNTGVGCHFLLQCMKMKWNWSLSVVSDSSWPHGLQPTRLLCPWDFPCKSTQFLVNVQNEKIKKKSKQIPRNLEIGLANSTTVPLDFYSLETTRLLEVKRLICITSHCAFCFIICEDSPLGFTMDSWQWKIWKDSGKYHSRVWNDTLYLKIPALFLLANFSLEYEKAVGYIHTATQCSVKQG